MSDVKNDRAQAIRKKRIATREAESKLQEDIPLAKAQELYDRIMNLLEAADGSVDEVTLYDRCHNKLQIGFMDENKDKEVESKAMQRLVQLFNATDGYVAEYHPGENLGSKSSVVIKIK